MTENAADVVSANDDLPDELRGLAAIAADHIAQEFPGTDAEAVRNLSLEIALDFAERFGSEAFYFPRALRYRLSERDAAIWAEFNGNNYVELARKYNRSPRHVRRLVGRMQELERNRTQGNLFGAAAVRSRR